ncbi:MAG: radical SAM/SPASM domain-containing protein [Candidatus Glassbacteria bacterium]
MRKIPFTSAIKLIARGTSNYRSQKVIALSFELTHSCTSKCIHCDKGGMKKETGLMRPEDYREYQQTLRPMLVQLSGGEPLLRKDIVEIARAVKETNGVPYLIVVTNARLLTEEIYRELKMVGVDQFSISLDFPDERHDAFRQSPGLYRHLLKIVPKLTSLGQDDIVLNTAITRDNFGSLLDIYKNALEWNANVSFSAYTPLRTGSMDHFISDPDDLAVLRETITELIRLKQRGGRIVNSVWTLSGTYEYFKNGGYMPGCNAGKRFLVVQPDGTLLPCSMRLERTFSSQEEILQEFTSTNACGACYVAIRAYLDENYWTLLRDNVSQRVFRKAGIKEAC